MSRAPGRRAIAALVFSAACTAAIAGPPFLTDGPEPVDLHHAEVNVIGQQTRALAGRAGSLSGEVNVGCAAETQCHFALPIAFDSRAGGSSRAGLGDMELGVKNSGSIPSPTTVGLPLSIRPWTCPPATLAVVSATDARSCCCLSGFNVSAIVSLAPHRNLLISAGRGLMHVETNRGSMFLAYQLEL